jgi:hypothetical protein
MSKFFISVKALSAVALSGVLIFSISCNNNNQPDVSPVSSVAKTEYTSEIDQMEKEEGVTFFKKDVLLKSKDGKSEVLMRFASKSQAALNAYLLDYNYTIKSMYDSDKSIRPTSEVKLTDNSSNTTPSVGSDFSVITEPISKKLAKNAIGYRLSVNLKEEAMAKLKNSRVASTSTNVHVSGVWPEETKISLLSGQNSVEYVIDKKQYWYYSWTLMFGWFTLSGANAQRSHWLDGNQAYGLSPWKVRVVVAYTPIPACGVCTTDVRGYEVEFFDY